MKRKIGSWILAVSVLVMSAKFLYLAGWVFDQVVTGAAYTRWILICIPMYALGSWSFYKLFRPFVHRAKGDGNASGFRMTTTGE